MADINGKDYLFQTIRWEDLIVSLNWEDNMNNIKKIMSPYLEFDYIDAGGRYNGYPFYFDANTHKLEIPSRNHVYIRKKGIYSLVMSNGKNGGKTPIELSKDGIDLTNTRLDLHEFNPGMSRFDLYLYDSSRVYVASDFENLIESEPSSKDKPYNEKGHSELKYLNKTGTGLGADMTYYAADNFSFKKDGNTYNLQGWTTIHQFNDKNLTETERVLDKETGKYLEQTYGYNIKGVETKQFNLGLYPIRIVWSNWEEHRGCDFYHDEDWDRYNKPNITCGEDEELICYSRTPRVFNTNIDLEIDKTYQNNFDYFNFNYTITFSVDLKQAEMGSEATLQIKEPQISFLNKNKKVSEWEQKYYSSIIKKETQNIFVLEDVFPWVGKHCSATRKITVDYSNINRYYIDTSYKTYWPTSDENCPLFRTSQEYNGEDTSKYKFGFNSKGSNESDWATDARDAFIFSTQVPNLKQKNGKWVFDTNKDGNFQWGDEKGLTPQNYAIPFIIDSQLKKRGPFFLSKGKYSTKVSRLLREWIDEEKHEIEEFAEEGRSLRRWHWDKAYDDYSDPDIFWVRNDTYDYFGSKFVIKPYYDASGFSVDSLWDYNSPYSLEDVQIYNAENFKTSVVVVLWGSPNNAPIFNKKHITITPQRTGSDTWNLAITNPFSESIQIKCGLTNSTKTITSTLKANEQSTITGFINGIWKISYTNPETNEPQIETIELK